MIEPLLQVREARLGERERQHRLMDGAARIERRFRFKDFGEAFAFVARAAGLADAEAHHPDVTFGWGYATVSLRTKGLHENDFIMAAKLDRIAGELGAARQEG